MSIYTYISFLLDYNRYICKGVNAQKAEYKQIQLERTLNKTGIWASCFYEDTSRGKISKPQEYAKKGLRHHN